MGKMVLNHRIGQKPGGGGMGLVHKAEDERMHYFLALNFLPEGLAQKHQALEGFRRKPSGLNARPHRGIG